jgi:hypothetical protein
VVKAEEAEDRAEGTNRYPPLCKYMIIVMATAKAEDAEDRSLNFAKSEKGRETVI